MIGTPGSSERTVAPAGFVTSSATPRLLSICLMGTFFFPPDMVLAPIGAVGFFAMLTAILLFAVWLGNVAFGLNDVSRHRSPARLGLAAIWIVSIIAYISASPFYATPVTRAAADRWLLTLAGMSGIILTIADVGSSTSRVAPVVRALSIGATFCALVALYQFATLTDPMEWIRSVMYGWSENGGNTTFQPRSPFVRVAGSTFHPIELGCISAMILPFAVWRAIFVSAGRRWMLWVQVSLIAVAALITVSRSAILALAVVILFFIPFLPTAARKWALVVTPVCIAGVFLVLPGFVSTIAGAFGAGTADPSIATRVSDYVRVEEYLSKNPWTGIGPGAYVPVDPLDILDNQYLLTAITLGVVGVLGLVAFLGLPMLSSLQVAILSTDPSLRCLAGAAFTGMAVAAITSGTFDSLSFPVFTIVVSSVVGLAAAVWQIARDRDSGSSGPLPAVRSGGRG